MYLIREANENDIPELIEVVKRSWFAVYPDFIDINILRMLSEQRHTFQVFYADMFIKDSYSAVVVDEDNKIIGMALVINSDEEDKEYGFIRRFYLLPESQRKGVGSQLMDHLVGKYRSKDMLLLEVEELNGAAVKFYQKHHFRTYRQQLQQIEGLELNYFYMMRILNI